jgi:hypothetical protein
MSAPFYLGGRESVEVCVDAEVTNRNQQLVGDLTHYIRVRTLMVKRVERLFIHVPIGITKIELAAVIEHSGPAVRFATPGTHDLRLIAIVEPSAATYACIHSALLSSVLRRMNETNSGWNTETIAGSLGHEAAMLRGLLCSEIQHFWTTESTLAPCPLTHAGLHALLQP